MSDLKLTVGTSGVNPIAHDLELTNNQITLTAETVEATAQRARIMLQFFEGEWYLDQREGLPYWRKILVHNPNAAEIRSMYRRALLDVPRIAAVDKLDVSIDRQAREGHMTFEATTDDGQPLHLDEPIIVTP